eukprot:15430427-Alexandrium_andersonii.AAC.1
MLKEVAEGGNAGSRVTMMQEHGTGEDGLRGLRRAATAAKCSAVFASGVQTGGKVSAGLGAIAAQQSKLTRL